MLKHLEPYLPAAALAQIEASAHTVLSYRLHAADDLPLTASRVGGIGYWPTHLDYPRNAHGQALALLAQFNFDELPHHPDLPDSGLLAFYIDPNHYGYGFHDDDPTDNRHTYTAYFPDTRAPSLSRDAQIALMPEEALAHYTPDEEDDEPSEEERAFQSRWQTNAEDMLQAWLAHREDVVKHIDDAELTRIWAQEKATLPVLSAVAAQVVAENGAAPRDTGEISDVLKHQYFFRSSERAAQIFGTHPQSQLWLLADDGMSEADMAQAVYQSQIIAQHIMTQGDPRWLQYWRHDPRAVIEEDLRMQSELLDFYGIDSLTAAWRKLLPELHAQMDDIIAEAERLPIVSAPELDQLLEKYTAKVLKSLREAFQRADETRRNAIRAFERHMLATRMERLAARFAAQGFVAPADNVPANMEEAWHNFGHILSEHVAHDDPFAAGKVFEGLGWLLGDSQEAQDNTQLYENINEYTRILDDYVTQNDAAELLDLWQSERDMLHTTPPSNKTAFVMHVTMTSAVSQWFFRQNIEHPAAEFLRAAMGMEMADHGTYWYHPVAGERAVQAELATQYLLFDNIEFEQHYGQTLPEWVDSLGLDDSAQRALHDAVPSLVNHNHLRGTPFFTQYDPRAVDDSENILLFQLDSDDNIGFGDSGIGQFFIRKDDLKNRRFENAWFYWDCY